MTTRQRTKILINCPLEGLHCWINQIKEIAAVKILKEPKMGLIMMRSRDTVAHEVFNSGEVLVSDCTVSVDNHPGYGVVMGNQPAMAEAMAIIDAVFSVRGEKWADLINNMQIWIEEQSRLQQKEQQSEFHHINRSKVNFEAMKDMGIDINEK